MPNTLKDTQSTIIVGLGTWTYTVTTAGLHFVDATATENPPSSLSIVINLNGSPIATSPTPSAPQQAVEAQALFPCAASDVITVVLSSSAAIDNQLNTVKTLINLRRGF